MARAVQMKTWLFVAPSSILVLLVLCGIRNANAQFLPYHMKRLETPEDFVGRIVKLYDNESPWWRSQNLTSEETARKHVFKEFYDPSFARLLNDNRTLASKLAGGVDLDYDPVCQCQDGPDDIRVTSVVRRPGPVANAYVTSGCLGERSNCRSWVIVIRRVAGAWRLYDVVEHGRSIRVMLTRHNACMRESRSETAIDRCLE